MLNARDIITALFVSFALGACATDRNSGNNTASAIRSSQDLEAYLQTTPDSPLNHLPADVRQRFLNSLMFSDKGLASFRYTDLKGLPATDVSQILSLFGIERTQDNTASNAVEIEAGENFRCIAPGTCAPAAGWICTDDC